MDNRPLAAVVAAVALGLAGCGGGKEETAGTAAAPPTPPPAATTEAPATTQAAGVTHVRLYFTDDEGTLRVVPGQVQGSAVATETLRALLANVEGESSAVPQGVELNGIVVADGTATVDLSGEFVSGGGSASMQARVAQVVFTLTQWPTVQRVTIEVDGEEVEAIGGEGVPARDLTRDDFEALLPAILVEIPVAGSSATSPMTVAGSASVFEANVSLRLETAGGDSIAETFATAEEGGPARGDFETTFSFEVDEATDATLVAFESSAADGSEQNVVRVPVRLCPAGATTGC